MQVDGTPYPGAPGSCNGLGMGEAAQGWRAFADPVNTDNKRFFGTNVNGAIWEWNSTLGPVIPEVGEPGSGQLLR